MHFILDPFKLILSAFEPEVWGMIISALIFIAAYVLIIWDKLDRTVVALSGASVMILFRILSQEKAFAEIDFNTLGLLISMMVIVMITKRSGIFEYVAIKAVKLAKAEPVRIIIILSLITAFLSAVLDNVTTILLVIPVTLSIAKDLHINPAPLVISEVFASNIGGTATLIGDPPNIMIASGASLSFMDFIKNNAVVIVPILLLTTYILVLKYRKKLTASKEAREKVLEVDEKAFIKDRSLLIKSIIVLALTVAGFMLHEVLGYESATVAMAGAVILLLISRLRPEKILHEVEWKTIFFFIGLFILVGGIRESGLIKLLAQGVLDITQGDTALAALAILWVSAIASAFVDNIPFVATMIPMLQDMQRISGMNITPLWWALSLGACLGGNGTIIGASANVIATGMLEEHGHKITFGRYFKTAFPLMLLSIVICTVYLFLRYLM